MEEEICSICKRGKLVGITKEENVETKAFSCGHREFRITVADKIMVTDSVHAIKIPSPVRALQETIDQKDWFKGIIMSATYFERLGIKKLKERFQSRGIIISPDRIERLELERIIMFLYGCGIIDQNTYSQMFEVKNKRKDLVHKIGPVYDLNEQEAERLIKKAIECVRKLL